MEEQFVLRVPHSVAERLDRLLGENASTDDKSLDLSFGVVMVAFYSHLVCVILMLCIVLWCMILGCDLCDAWLC
ncbi:hypothetical protein TB2_028302 [Malus domestica]